MKKPTCSWVQAGTIKSGEVIRFKGLFWIVNWRLAMGSHHVHLFTAHIDYSPTQLHAKPRITAIAIQAANTALILRRNSK